MARLVHLQIQILPTGVTVVNLDEHSLKRFLAHHGNFFQVRFLAFFFKLQPPIDGSRKI